MDLSQSTVWTAKCALGDRLRRANRIVKEKKLCAKQDPKAASTVSYWTDEAVRIREALGEIHQKRHA